MINFNSMPMGSMPEEDGDGKNGNFNPMDYRAFGNQSKYAYDQGWLPVVQSGGATVYKNRYAQAFNNSMFGNKPTGDIQLIGNNNGKFDVVIMGKDGKVEHTIMKEQPFSEVDNYFRNNKSIIQQRMNRVQSDPSIQQYNGITWNQ